jgi:NAD(P)-dependent dehydrogenase (short-subunit alcohol dehydrogenase family)
MTTSRGVRYAKAGRLRNEAAEAFDELFDVRGKVVVVVGADIGAGRTIAEQFRSTGATVYSVMSGENIQDAHVCATKGVSVCIALGERGVEGYRNLAGRISQVESSVDVLVSVHTLSAAEVDDDASAWNVAFSHGVKEMFFLVQSFEELLRNGVSGSDPGRVISIDESERSLDSDSYAVVASTASLHHLCADLAGKLAPSQITVNAVTVGQAADAAEDAAEVSLYLSSKAGSYVTGSVIAVGGAIAKL